RIESARDGSVQAIVGTDDTVQQKARRSRRREDRVRRFGDVVATRVAVDDAGARMRIGLEPMVDANRARFAEAGEQCLYARTEPGEVVRANAARGDHEVGLDEAAMHAYRCAARGRA